MMRSFPVYDFLPAKTAVGRPRVEIALAAATPQPDTPAGPEIRRDELGRILSGGKLLIVEDEFLVAQDLIYGPQRDGIDVLGPVGTIADALDLVHSTDNIGAAIVDLNIRGQLAFELAEKLREKNIPFIFYTGYESVIVPEKFRKISRVRKPADWTEIRKALFDSEPSPLLGSRLVKQLSRNAPDLASMLPALRARAREITVSKDVAELLVERTLERAIREIGACPAGVPMEHWLIGLLETTGIGKRQHVN